MRLKIESSYMKNNKRFYSVLFMIIAFVIIGAKRSNIYKQIRDSQATINSVYRHLITHYVDDIDLEKFTKLSIDNMLSDLDPYTVYLIKDQRSNLDMLTKGKYGGVGIQIGKRDKRLTVISPMDNSPAKRAGIVSGDIIVKINDQITDKMSMDDAAKLIRGQKGSSVTLTIERFGYDEWTDYDLIRESIKVKDVSYAGMLNETTGYIRLVRFSKNSASEMETALSKLLANDMSSLILDLRDNPGGLLNSAVGILDMFIEKGELLVWTGGKTKQSHRKYFSKNKPIVPGNIQIAVLINKGSASASEIVSGVMQDLDRGVVIGRQSFGKGLVQTIYNLDKDKSLKVTTAKYYIPSGRLIQRKGYLPDELLADSSEVDTLFETIGGRRVTGGGGIKPDHIIDLEPISPIFSACRRNGLFFTFVQKNNHLYESFDDVSSDNTLMDQFEDLVYSSDLDILLKGESSYLDTREMFIRLDSNNVSVIGAIDLLDRYFEEQALTQFDREKKILKNWIMMEFAEHFNGMKGRIRIMSEIDMDMIKALETLQDPFVYKEVFIPQ
tara:strand:+ start:1266 stop:2927 length:1662 start_codon:yes stop_codon:yes gene_type:complete